MDNKDGRSYGIVVLTHHGTNDKQHTTRISLQG